MWEFFSKIFDRQTPLLLILGAAFALVCAFHGVPIANWTIKTDVLLWIPGGLAVLFLMLGVFSFFGFFTNRKPSMKHLKKAYEIKITSHNLNESVPSPIELRGTFKKKPGSGRVFAIERNDSRHQYYIKNEVVFYDNNNTWHTQINIGNGDNLPRTLIVAYFGEDSKRLLEYYMKVRKEAGHVGIQAFPSDYQSLAEVTIRLQRP